MKINSQLTFILFSLILLVIRLLWIKNNNLELYGDEAQYWVWSQNFAFGYYSKPPFVAWVIAISTYLFGDSEFAIRLFSPILHFLTGIIVYKIGKTFSDEIGLVSGLLYLTIPAVFVSSGLISTDPILLLFWALALYCLIEADRTGKMSWWLLCGIASGCGMMTKYNMLLFLACALLYLYHSHQSFKFVYLKGFWLALLSAMVIFSPNVIWNIKYSFANVMHTVDLVHGDPRNKFSFVKLGEFFIAQFGVFGPITFSLVLTSIYLFCRGKLRKNHKGLFFFAVPMLIAMLFISFISRAHANWAAPAYISSSVLAVLIAKHFNKLYLIKLSIMLHLLIGLSIMFYRPVLRNLGIEVSPKYDIYKRLRGGKALGENLIEISNRYPECIIAADTRKEISLMTYYTKAESLEIIKWNPSHRISDHYALITDANKFIGKDMLVISKYGNDESRIKEEENLKAYGDNVKFIGILSSGSDPNYMFKHQVFYLENFKGY